MSGKKSLVVVAVVLAGTILLAACAVPTPEVVREEVPITVEVTKVVKGTPETVVEEVVVTATPEPTEPTPTPCEPALDSPPMLRPGKLIFAVNATIPPFQYIDDQGNLQGERIELGNEIARRLCLEPEWINVQWEAVIPGLQGERWDCINSGMYFTEERAELMELVPYEVSALAINVPKGNPDDVSSPEDVAGMPVGSECPGFEYEELKKANEEQVDAGLESMDIRCFDNYADAYQALEAGQIRAVINGSVAAKWYETKGQFASVPLDIAGTGQCLAFKSTELAEAVAETFEEMKADGTYDEIMDKWGGGKVTMWEGWEGGFKVY
jgi:polar amino acid transport system substrate-binding protein